MHFTLVKEGCPPVNLDYIGEAVTLTTVGIDSPRPGYHASRAVALETLVREVVDYLNEGYAVEDADAQPLDD